MTDMKTDAMEMYPDGNELNIRSTCPDKEGMGCETDSDCTKQISGGKLSEQCSKCVCWNVPVCDIKKYFSKLLTICTFLYQLYRSY